MILLLKIYLFISLFFSSINYYSQLRLFYTNDNKIDFYSAIKDLTLYKGFNLLFIGFLWPFSIISIIYLAFELGKVFELK